MKGERRGWEKGKAENGRGRRRDIAIRELTDFAEFAKRIRNAWFGSRDHG